MSQRYTPPRRALALLLTLLLPQWAGAANFRWMENTPARHFVDSDWEMLRTTADKVLNEGRWPTAAARRRTAGGWS